MNHQAGKLRETVDEVSSGALGAKAAEVASRVEGAVKEGNLGKAGAEVSAAASDLKAAAVDQGRQLLEAARDKATGFADQRKNDAAQSVSDIASSLRETGRSFEDRPNIQAFVSSAAEGLEQLAGGIRDRSFADLYGEAEDYARRAPMTVGLVALGAGFLLARCIKSSADRMSEASAASRSAATRARDAAPRPARLDA